MKSDKVLQEARALQLLNAHKSNVVFHGYSMEPLLTEGDSVAINKIAFKDIRIGDIIVSYEGEKYPARRVLYKKKNSLVVWRDNWAHREILEIYEKDVLGKIIARNRNNQVVASDDFSWKLLKIWAFLRLIPGRFIHYCPPVKNYIEKHHVKQGPIYE